MNILQKYLEERHKEHDTTKDYGEPGPVVTISREFGSSGKFLAQKLAFLLNESKLGDTVKGKWKVISKEILEQSAKELELHPSEIEYVFKYEKKSDIDEVLGALSSKYYKSDRMIRNTIKKIIYTFGLRGNVIILGRGGEILTQEIERSLHVKLIAPFPWRVEEIKKRFGYEKIKEARNHVADMDKKRDAFKSDIAGKEVDNTLYDVIFNVTSFPFDQMSETIMHMMELKKMI
ncbi:MAG: cytidylate kinase-like family protein [Bacteroidales bacterium]